ncbi:MAG: caspase family protein [Clostridiales bacterium]|nr:caspase family protein [Clostridiales bacterium]
MQKLLGIILLLSSLFVHGGNLPEQKPETPRLRALLIGCDHFVTQEDTWPAADLNLQMLKRVLEGDRRGYDVIRTASGTVTDEKTLREETRKAFSDAQTGDISLLYFSTHGLLRQEKNGYSASLVFSDGKEENEITGWQLREITDQIPGKKIIIFDACSSGALIGKGLSEPQQTACFSGSEYKILCSAGGNEASWYWQAKDGGHFSGASYFNAVFTSGLNREPYCAADGNRDGEVTLSEMYGFLLENCAVSTPCVYPQNDEDFVLYSYAPEETVNEPRTITDLYFDSTLLTAGESEARFSFTVHRQTELYYQIVYLRDGVWQFAEAQQYQDMEQENGTVRPGRKERTLEIRTPEEKESGYAMILLITKENGKTVYQASRLLCVQPAEGEIKLFVETASSFIPLMGQEIPVYVRHGVPCAVTVNIISIEGNPVRRLAYEAPSRPQQLTPAGSVFYWDGRMTNGEIAPYGWYRAVVRVSLSGEKFTAESRPFRLMYKTPD